MPETRIRLLNCDAGARFRCRDHHAPLAFDVEGTPARFARVNRVSQSVTMNLLFSLGGQVGAH